MNTKKITFSFLICAITCYTSQSMSMRRAFLHTARNIQTMRSMVQQGYATNSMEYQAAKLKEIEARKAVLDSIPLQDKVLMAAGASAEFATKASIAKEKLKCASGSATAWYASIAPIWKARNILRIGTSRINQISYDRTLLDQLNKQLKNDWLIHDSTDGIITGAKTLKIGYAKLVTEIESTNKFIARGAKEVFEAHSKKHRIYEEFAGVYLFFGCCPFPLTLALVYYYGYPYMYTGIGLSILLPILSVYKAFSFPNLYDRKGTRLIQQLYGIKNKLYQSRPSESEYKAMEHLVSQILNKEINPKS